MEPKGFSPPHVEEQELQELVSRIHEYAQQFRGLIFARGVHLKDISITATSPEKIEHGLRRTPIGWLVTRRSAAAVVFESGAFDERYLTLDASANVTVDLWVF